MNKVFNDEKASAFDHAVASMPSSEGLPCTEFWLFGEMTCYEPTDDDTPPEPFWPAFWAWLRSPHFFPREKT